MQEGEEEAQEDSLVKSRWDCLAHDSLVHFHRLSHGQDTSKYKVFGKGHMLNCFSFKYTFFYFRLQQDSHL